MDLLLASTLILVSFFALIVATRGIYLSKTLEDTKAQLEHENSKLLKAMRHVEEVGIANIKLEDKIKRSYYTQYRVNGKFAKRPDPIVEAYKNDPVAREQYEAYKERKNAT